MGTTEIFNKDGSRLSAEKTEAAGNQKKENGQTKAAYGCKEGKTLRGTGSAERREGGKENQTGKRNL